MTDIYAELGVRPVLNAQGNRTLLGGSTPSPAVNAMMAEMGEYYVDLGELMDSVANHISEMLGVERALVTSGCSAALAVGAAACMTGDDPEKIKQIPDTTGLPYEFIIQRQLRVRYDRCMSIPGGKLVEIGNDEGTTVGDLEAAIGPNTAGVHYLAPGNQPGALPIEEVIRVAHSHNVPVIVDAAGQVYPTDLLSKYVKMGADLVAYGAKYFGAVNSSGILTGRGELVDIARKHSFIGFEDSESGSFGRPMKVDRQEVVGVYAALREWLTTNHEDRFAIYEERIEGLKRDLGDIPHIELSNHSHPPGSPAEGLLVHLDHRSLGKTAIDVVNELRDGNPSIWVRSPNARPDDYPEGQNSFVIRMPTLKEGGEKVIAQRLRDILTVAQV
jgi:L-seryl-tRNA(Ser) seleniumtransferase